MRRLSAVFAAICKNRIKTILAISCLSVALIGILQIATAPAASAATPKSTSVSATTLTPEQISAGMQKWGAVARCIWRHESINHGWYQAQNPTSSASGAYQFTKRTWAFHRGFTRAKDAPDWVQDEMFLIVWNDGRRGKGGIGPKTWKGTHCGYRT